MNHFSKIGVDTAESKPSKVVRKKGSRNGGVRKHAGGAALFEVPLRDPDRRVPARDRKLALPREVRSMKIPPPSRLKSPDIRLTASKTKEPWNENNHL